MKKLSILLLASLIVGSALEAGAVRIKKIKNDSDQAVIFARHGSQLGTGPGKNYFGCYIPANSTYTVQKHVTVTWAKDDSVTAPSKNYTAIATKAGRFLITQGWKDLKDKIRIIDTTTDMVSEIAGDPSTKGRNAKIVINASGAVSIRPN